MIHYTLTVKSSDPAIVSLYLALLATVSLIGYVRFYLPLKKLKRLVLSPSLSSSEYWFTDQLSSIAVTSVSSSHLLYLIARPQS